MSSAEANKLLLEIIEDFEKEIAYRFDPYKLLVSRDADFLNVTLSADITLSITRLLANFPFPKVNKRHYLLQVFDTTPDCDDVVLCEVLCEDEIDLNAVEEQILGYQDDDLYEQWRDLRNLIEREPDEVKPNT